MEKFHLEKPSPRRKTEALAYLEEHVLYNSYMNGTGGMDKCLFDTTYEQWLEELTLKTNPSYMDTIGWAPSITFFLIRETDDKIIGMLNLRYNLTEKIIKLGGSHIGYGIRPSERGKGYSKINLYLGLLEEEKLGEDSVLLECTADNIASNKTIQALGGVLEKSAIDPYDGELTNYYWIDVASSIEKYKDNYMRYIAS